jgi:hypothetical protein
LLQYCVAACLRCSHTGVYAALLDCAAPCLEAKSIILRDALKIIFMAFPNHVIITQQ